MHTEKTANGLEATTTQFKMPPAQRALFRVLLTGTMGRGGEQAGSKDAEVCSLSILLEMYGCA